MLENVQKMLINYETWTYFIVRNYNAASVNLAKYYIQHAPE